MIEWRSIPGLPTYLVSSDGQVRHMDSDRPRKLQRHIGSGYLYVNFWKNKKLKITSVHTLVAAAFLGPRPDGCDVRHLDGNPENNCISNLAYGTRKENAADRERHGRTRRGERNGNAVLSNMDVDRIRDLYATGEWSQYQLAAEFRASQSQINNIVLHKQRRAA